MFRDTLRRQLRFATLRVDFRSIVVQDQQPQMCVYSLSQPEITLPWSTVTEYLKTVEKVIFDYTLQAVETDEDEYEYEYDGPLLALVNKLVVTATNDVGLKVEGEPLDELSKALSRFEGSSSKVEMACRPEHFFSSTEEIAGMRDYHEGYEYFL